MIVRTGLLACLSLSALSAATPDAFVGDWIFNSKMTGVTFDVRHASANNYTLMGSDGMKDEVAADGAFHQSQSEAKNQMSFQQIAKDEWTLKTKKSDDPSQLTSIYKLQSDGKSLLEKAEMTTKTGDHLAYEATWTRSQASPRIDGHWTLTKYAKTKGSQFIFTIAKDGPNQLTFTSNYASAKTHFRSLDGKPYRNEDSPDETTSLRLLDGHSLESADYKDGALIQSGKWTVSPDGKTLSMTVTPKGKAPYSVSYSKR